MGFLAAPGAILEGRYKLIEPLGRGGMGAVWRAEHTKLASNVAVKLIAATTPSAEALERFRREAQIAAALDSPHIVRVQDFGVEADTPFIVMELLPGETLGARLAARGALDPAATLRLFGHIARGIGRAHQAGVIHRDLKPENVFIASVDGEDIAKVLDFGIARAPGLDLLTRTGNVLGTLQYMSPEQLEARRDIDHRSDLYALAVIAFERVCGRAAFVAESVAELIRSISNEATPVPSKVADVPLGFDDWFARGAHHDPSQRFASAREMVDALAAIVGETAIPTSTARGVANPRALEPTVTAAARHGDERAGFRVTPDVATRTLEVELWGYWEVSLAERMRAAFFEAFEVMKGSPWVALCFGSRHPPQKPEVQALEGATMGAAAEFGLARTAFVIDAALATMMARRLAETNAMPGTRFFTDEREERAWLRDSEVFVRSGGTRPDGDP